MATRYVRTRYSYVSSDSSDYSRPRIKELLEDTFTPDEVRQIEVEVATGGTTITTSDLASVSKVAIVNEDTTNFVTALWYYPQGAEFSDVVTFAQAGTGDTMTDDSSGGTFISTSGATTGDFVRIQNAATSGNDGTHQIRTAAASVITFVDESTFTADAADTVTLQFCSRNTQGIETGEELVISGASDGALVPGLNLLLTADTAACTCRVFLFGT